MSSKVYGVDVDDWAGFISAYQSISEGTTLNLLNDIYAVDTESIGSTQSNNFTVDGGGNIMDSQQFENLGFILNGSSITFKNISFIGFLKTDNIRGGVFNTNQSNLTFSGNIEFSSNNLIATSGNGGAGIYGGGGSKINFINANVLFSSNTDSLTTTNNSGGIINIDGAAASIAFINSTASFANNTLVGGIEGIVVAARGGSNMSFIDSNLFFTNNKGDNASGVIFANGGSIISFSNSAANFISNNSGGTGAVVHLYRAFMSVAHSTLSFKNNSDRGGEGGGVFYIKSNSSASFVNSSINFTNNSATRGGALYFKDSSTFSFVNSAVDFSGNTSGNNGGGGVYIGANALLIFENSDVSFVNNKAGFQLNDIRFYDNTGSMIFYENNTLPNGVRISGNGLVQKRGEGLLVFAGENSVIATSFFVEGGSVNFKSAVSSISVLTMENNSTLSLANNSAGTQLFISTLSLNANLILDINFTNGAADKINTSSVTIFAGNNLVINKLDTDGWISNEIGIISAYDFFGINQNGVLENAVTDIFNYDTSHYALRFDDEEKTLYIKNFASPPPPSPASADIDIADSENQKEIEDIFNSNRYLRSAASNLKASQQRFIFDDLSGVFLANIFSSLLYSGNEVLFTQISKGDIYKPWVNVNYSNLEFNKPQQSLGIFKLQSIGLKLGADLFANRIWRAGFFLGGAAESFNQANNNANLLMGEGGLYADIAFKGFGIQTLAGAKYWEGTSKREIKLDEIYNPQSNIYALGFNAAAKLDYDFLLMRNRKMQVTASPFILYEFDQIDMEAVEEKEGKITDLYLRSGVLQKHTAKGGFEFRQKTGKYDFFINVFAGQNLNSRHEFQAEFIDLGENFEVRSDEENLFFYGGGIGANAVLTKSIKAGMQFNMALNDEFINYNAGLNIQFALPKRPQVYTTRIPQIPILRFMKNSSRLTKESSAELARFAKHLLIVRPSFRRVVLTIGINISKDSSSARPSALTVERSNVVMKALTKNSIPKQKITIARSTIMRGDKVEIGIEWDERNRPQVSPSSAPANANRAARPASRQVAPARQSSGNAQQSSQGGQLRQNVQRSTQNARRPNQNAQAGR
ncbi:MAG: hypothetical protein LBC07_05700 [Elusimicrobiota bacterium]|nr:hypothetical protein [Elusimicrobiota bacterium]